MDNILADLEIVDRVQTTKRKWICKKDQEIEKIIQEMEELKYKYSNLETRTNILSKSIATQKDQVRLRKFDLFMMKMEENLAKKELTRFYKFPLI